MAIRIEHTGNNAEQIAVLLRESGLFHEVSYDSSTQTADCFGADGNLRYRLRTMLLEGRQAAQHSFRISESSGFTAGITSLYGPVMAVDTVYVCRRGVILACNRNAVLLTKNNLGENLYAVGSESAASTAEALRSMRVYAYGDMVRSTYPVNLYTGYNQRDGETVFVPFVSDPGSSEVLSYTQHAFFLPFYQFDTSGAMHSDTHRYLNFAGCWAVSDD